MGQHMDYITLGWHMDLNSCGLHTDYVTSGNITYSILMYRNLEMLRVHIQVN